MVLPAGRPAVVRALAPTIAALALAATASARADDAEITLEPGSGVLGPMRARDDFPFVTGQTLSVLTDTRILQASVPGAETNDLNPDLQLALALYLAPQVSLQGLAAIGAPDPTDGDRAFAGLDGSLSNLFLNYDGDTVTAYVGKFDTWFGQGWRTIDGVYSGFSADYYFQGVLGAGGSLIARTEAGTHELGIAVFKRDNTGLNDSWIESRDCPAIAFTCVGRLRPEAGGPGNTDWPQSVAATFDWSDIPFAPGLGLGIDVARLAAGSGGGKSLTGVAARLAYQAPLADGITLSLFAEAVWLDGFLGRDVTATDLVASASVTVDPVQVTVTAARRDLAAGEGSVAGQGLNGDGDWGLALSATYPTDIGIILQAGAIWTEEQGVDATIGRVRAIYQWRF